MKLSELLRAIEQIANDKGLSKPYIVGGLARDKTLKRVDDINDVDITTGDETVHYLARHVGNALGSSASFEVKKDGHARIKIGNFKIDFSSNFIIPGISDILNKSGITDPSEMQQELYSRDFTCNALLMTLDLEKILDPTGLAINDINKNIIDTCLSPEITLGYDNKRIVRAIYLAGKLSFNITDDVKKWITEHPSLITNAPPGYVEKKITKGLKYNSEIVISLLHELGLIPYLPPIPELSFYIKRSFVNKSSKVSKKKNKIDLDVRPYPNPFFKGYDYSGPEEGSEVSPGTGLYHGKMDRFKSVKEFLEKARKRKYRKKSFINITKHYE